MLLPFHWQYKLLMEAFKLKTQLIYPASAATLNSHLEKVAATTQLGTLLLVPTQPGTNTMTIKRLVVVAELQAFNPRRCTCMQLFRAEALRWRHAWL